MTNDMMAKGAWADLAQTGATLALRITPNARHNTLTRTADELHCSVTAAPDDDEANHAVTVLLAHALGVDRDRLIRMQGATSRDKLFRLD